MSAESRAPVPRGLQAPPCQDGNMRSSNVLESDVLMITVSPQPGSPSSERHGMKFNSFYRRFPQLLHRVGSVVLLHHIKTDSAPCEDELHIGIKDSGKKRLGPPWSLVSSRATRMATLVSILARLLQQVRVSTALRKFAQHLLTSGHLSSANFDPSGRSRNWPKSSWQVCFRMFACLL